MQKKRDKKIHKPYRKQIKKLQKSLLISNYFKYKWTKFSHQKTKIGRLNLNKKRFYLCAIYETHFIQRHE